MGERMILRGALYTMLPRCTDYIKMQICFMIRKVMVFNK